MPCCIYTGEFFARVSAAGGGLLVVGKATIFDIARLVRKLDCGYKIFPIWSPIPLSNFILSVLLFPSGEVLGGRMGAGEVKNFTATFLAFCGPFPNVIVFRIETNGAIGPSLDGTGPKKILTSVRSFDAVTRIRTWVIAATTQCPNH